MTITPLPKELGDDLNALKELIDERLNAITSNSEQVSAIMTDSDNYRSEVKILQEEISILSGAKVRRDVEGVTEFKDGVKYVSGERVEEVPRETLPK